MLWGNNQNREYYFFLLSRPSYYLFKSLRGSKIIRLRE